MRCPYQRALLVMSASMGVLVYMQVVIFFREHTAEGGHIEQEKRNFLLASHTTESNKVKDTESGVVPKRTTTIMYRKTSETNRLLEKKVEKFGSPFQNGINDINFTELPFWARKFLSDYETYTNYGGTPPEWQKHLYNRTKYQTNPNRYFLSELLMVRLYTTDLAKWTIRELKQWMHYMFLIGTEHIYICDHFHPGDRDLEEQLVQYITLGLVTYSRVSTHRAMTAQVQCYRRWVTQVGGKSTWMTTIDMDEYPYVIKDHQENCLQRYLKTFHDLHPNVAEISMPNYLMLGQGDRTVNITIDRIRRSTPKAANKLVKPVFMPEFYIPDIHHGAVKGGKEHVDADVDELRMLHFWGARLQKWGPDTLQMFNSTVPFSDMADAWAGRIRNSLLAFGENDAFSSRTGP